MAKWLEFVRDFFVKFRTFPAPPNFIEILKSLFV